MGNKIQTVLVENNSGTGNQIKKMLESVKRGTLYELHQFSSLSAATEYLDNYPADVILTDVLMPETFIQKTPVIFIAESSADLGKDPIRGGAQEYLLKDMFDTEILTRTIQYAIERKELEQRKNDFISATSHELKTPLTSQKAFIRLLLRQIRKNNDIEYSYYINKIAEQTDKLAQLVNDLLDLSKIKGGKLVYNPELFDLSDMIFRLVEEFYETSTHTIEINIDGHDNSFYVQADRDRIYQVMTNLIMNAMKYSPPSKVIEINLHSNNTKAIVSVKDQGIGIAKKYQKKIFEPFFRTYQTSDSTFPGLGMGLYLSREIITHHGGNMWVESKKGLGSTFFFTLPNQ